MFGEQLSFAAKASSIDEIVCFCARSISQAYNSSPDKNIKLAAHDVLSTILYHMSTRLVYQVSCRFGY
jgi:hypothetical protein